jgi:hypothetical protein
LRKLKNSTYLLKLGKPTSQVFPWETPVYDLVSWQGGGDLVVREVGQLDLDPVDKHGGEIATRTLKPKWLLSLFLVNSPLNLLPTFDLRTR